MVRSDSDTELPVQAETPPSKPPTPWQFLQDHMHGRWRYALPLAAATAVIGGVAGFVFAPAKFVATGYVRVDPTVDYVLESTPEVVPMYDAIVDTQVQMLQLDNLLSRALDTDEIREQGVRDAFPSISALRDALTVSRERRGTFVKLQVEADEPADAFYMARSILEEYRREVAPDEKYESRRDEIQNLINKDAGEIAAKRSERLNPSNTNQFTSYPDEALDSTRRLSWELLSSHVQELAGMGVLVSPSDFGRAESIVTTNDVPSGDTDEAESGATATEAGEGREPTRRELEDLDRLLATYRGQMHAEMDALEALREEFGDNHASVREQQTRVNIATQRFDDSENAARALWKEQYPWLRDGQSVDPARLAAIVEKGHQLWGEMEFINAELQRRFEIDAEIQHIESGLALLQQSLESLEYNERSLKRGHTSITMPIMPQTPEKTKKRQLAIVGFFGGFGLPICLFLLLSHVDRRAFGIVQINPNHDANACIGVVPDLGLLESSTESQELTAACVHRFRNRLELSGIWSDNAVIAVTSPFQGDGKTNFAFALAWSYASAGHRTVLIDADLTGQTLSNEVHRLDEPGFRELLVSDEVNGEVCLLSEKPHLSVIGVGCDGAMAPEGVTRADVIRALGRLRTRFEIIILDTGPLLGSVEALPIVSATDGVILTLRRGRSRRGLDECAKELSLIGAPLLGVVLNCADPSECRRYTSASRVSVRSLRRARAEDQTSGVVETAEAALIDLMRNNGLPEFTASSTERPEC